MPITTGGVSWDHGVKVGMEGKLECQRTHRVQVLVGEDHVECSPDTTIVQFMLLTSGDAASLSSERQISSRQLMRVHVCSSDSVTCTRCTAYMYCKLAVTATQPGRTHMTHTPYEAARHVYLVWHVQ